MRVALIGCGKAKRVGPSRACDLYTGALFRLSWRYAVQTCERVLVLSAKHGVLDPQRIVAPYDLALKHMGVPQRAQWGQAVARTLESLLQPTDVMVVLAGKPHAVFLEYLPGYTVEFPLGAQRLGKRLAWLKVAVRR